MSKQRNTILEVVGMSCPSCISHVGSALEEIAGVATIDVKIDDGLVVVRHDPATAPALRLIEVLQTAGYSSAERSAV